MTSSGKDDLAWSFSIFCMYVFHSQNWQIFFKWHKCSSALSDIYRVLTNLDSAYVATLYFTVQYKFYPSLEREKYLSKQTDSLFQLLKYKKVVIDKFRDYAKLGCSI